MEEEYYKRIPGFEDGGRIKRRENPEDYYLPHYSLPEVSIYPENRFGDIARSQGYQTARNWRTVKEGTTAGINSFVEHPLTQGALALLPMPSAFDGIGSALGGIGKIWKRTKNAKRIKNPEYYSYGEEMGDYLYSENGAKVLTNQTMDNRYILKNKLKYWDDVDEIAWEAMDPNNFKFVEDIDKTFSTNYASAYKQIFDYDNSGKYLGKVGRPNVGGLRNLDFADLPGSVDGRLRINPDRHYIYDQDYTKVINPEDYQITLDATKRYSPSLAKHEVGHLVDAVESGELARIWNPYLDYLQDIENIVPLRDIPKYSQHNFGNLYESFLKIPTESKSHLLEIKKRLKDSGYIKDIMQPTRLEDVENLMKETQRPALRFFYDIHRDKNRVVQRLNQLTPASIIPAIPAGNLFNEQSNNK